MLKAVLYYSKSSVFLVSWENGKGEKQYRTTTTVFIRRLKNKITTSYKDVSWIFLKGRKREWARALLAPLDTPLS